jgi:hypothetical protein
MTIKMNDIENFVNNRLGYAKTCPGNADVFEAQAFGAVEFFAIALYNNDEQDKEIELLEKWNNDWSQQFTDIRIQHANRGM